MINVINVINMLMIIILIVSLAAMTDELVEIKKELEDYNKFIFSQGLIIGEGVNDVEQR